jgi:formate--tetrahydrofolate ligase
LRHIENVKRFGMPVCVAVNHFNGDTEEEFNAIVEAVKPMNVSVISCSHWADGAKGAKALAEKVVELADSGAAKFQYLYEDDASLEDKIRAVATKIDGAADIALLPKAKKRLDQLQADGFGQLPVCVAKTQYSFSCDPKLLGAPTGHTIPVREIRVAAGAGFVVAICGDVMTLPGLPRHPAALDIFLNDKKQIEGLF